MDVGLDAWLTEQFAATAAERHVERLARGVNLAQSVWEAYLAGHDQLRTRVGYALSQIFVVSDLELDARQVAAFADLLEANAFGTYRDLLEHITRSQAMGRYLTYERNQRADERRGNVPDENYAREVMQLFSIGLWELHRDGTRRLADGEPIPTYDTDDILGLARVFTGFRAISGSTPDTPMTSTDDFADRWHERGEKRFLGVTIPEAETRTLDESLAIALDTLDAHPNTPPFLSKQLIQRLVTSNPSPAYVDRVAAVWEDDGSAEHVRGNLGAVVRAVLLDDEAWDASPSDVDGKIREPVLRFTNVVRALNVSCSNSPWPMGSLSDTDDELGQQPFESHSVFNFYRPGYVPPQTPIGDQNLLAPELQIHNETAAIGWINYLQRFLLNPPRWRRFSGTPDEIVLEVSYSIDDLLALADGEQLSDADAGVLVDELTARLCPQGVSPSVRALVVRAVTGVTDTAYNSTNLDYRARVRDRAHLNRVMGAAVMIAASTDFLHER